MKKHFLICLVIIFLTSCQKTPSEQSIIGEYSNEFEHALDEELLVEFSQNDYIESIPNRWEEL